MAVWDNSTSISHGGLDVWDCLNEGRDCYEMGIQKNTGPQTTHENYVSKESV